MVTRAWGSANGLDITFEHKEGDIWEADVPWTEDGSYAAEIYAEDEAGNIGYLCTMLFVISGYELRCFIIHRGYMMEIKEGGFTIGSVCREKNN